MAQPNKDAKAKGEEDNKEQEGEEKKGGGLALGNNIKMIIINVTTTALVCIIFIVTNFVIQNASADKMLSVFKKSQEEAMEAENEDEDTQQKGVILELGDFTLNLADISPRAFLKVNVAIEVSKTEEELNKEEAAKESSGGGHGGHGGHGGEGEGEKAPAAANPGDEFNKPALRDAVITVLSSKTSDELSSTTGKELVKEQLIEAINAVFDGEREVLRVSFGDFIMQHGR